MIFLKRRRRAVASASSPLLPCYVFMGWFWTECFFMIHLNQVKIKVIPSCSYCYVVCVIFYFKSIFPLVSFLISISWVSLSGLPLIDLSCVPLPWCKDSPCVRWSLWVYFVLSCLFLLLSCVPVFYLFIFIYFHAIPRFALLCLCYLSLRLIFDLLSFCE